jgi:poly(beta-D-mannuronate) lyase
MALALIAGLLSVARADPAIACPPPPPPVRDIDLPRFYADTEGSVVDPALAARHKAAVEPLTAFLRHVVSDADRSLRRAKPEARQEAARCALAWLEAWARGDAWLGRMASRQAEYQRKWDLAGVALAYIKVRRHATPEQRRLIEPWLVRFADAARAFFDDPARRRNNHWYWLGLALGATAMAVDSDRHWAEAGLVMDSAVRDIRADGTLAHELERRSRALHYHAFAAMPLVVLAELAAARGEDWYALGDGALHRLVRATVDGLADPERFRALAGEPQERPSRAGAGWIRLYAARFPHRLGTTPADAPQGHRWLGGDVGGLREALPRRP